ncbi:MAG: Nif3-like dinuclear metal center hexameric protein [Akkermansiaceae bacterium]
MAKLQDITEFLDSELQIDEIPDYPGAFNGLQLENAGEVSAVVAAVDASLPVIEKAVAAGADLLIVHHGMFWHGTQMVTGANYRKLKLAMDAGLAIYSSHIPLDVHPQWGNNALLAKAIGMSEAAPFFDWKGIQLGLKQDIGIPLERLRQELSEAVGGDVHCCPGGDDAAGVVGLITGGAGSEVAAMAKQGINTFITGEGPHWSYPLAEELGVNILYAGHYATETFGVRKLVDVVGEKFMVHLAGEHGFVDHPTGL